MNPRQLAAMIDHTALKPEATPGQIERLCGEAHEFGFATVCVNPVFVPLAARLLGGSPVKVCTVTGFPLGASGRDAKIQETRIVLKHGAQEVDMVLWVGGLKAGDYQGVEEEIADLARICSGEGALLKVILECVLLSDEEKRTACRLCVLAGAHYVKTSTGFASGGATVHDVKLMHMEVGDRGLGVKAAGGIRTLAEALEMIKAGATRIGASAGVKILEEMTAGSET